eukprot:15459925-Alexandrium_andersonii.AAC.1
MQVGSTASQQPGQSKALPPMKAPPTSQSLQQASALALALPASAPRLPAQSPQNAFCAHSKTGAAPPPAKAIPDEH